MAKLRQKYESVVVLNGSLSEGEIKRLVDKFKKLISKNANLISSDEWGKRKLAYPIEKQNDGFYILFVFESKPDFVAELNRIYNITDGVIRTLVIAKEDVKVVDPKTVSDKKSSVKTDATAQTKTGSAEPKTSTSKTPEKASSSDSESKKSASEASEKTATKKV